MEIMFSAPDAASLLSGLQQLGLIEVRRVDLANFRAIVTHLSAPSAKAARKQAALERALLEMMAGGHLRAARGQACKLGAATQGLARRASANLRPRAVH